mgnify:CR=1 FL=1
MPLIGGGALISILTVTCFSKEWWWLGWSRNEDKYETKGPMLSTIFVECRLLSHRCFKINFSIFFSDVLAEDVDEVDEVDDDVVVDDFVDDVDDIGGTMTIVWIDISGMEKRMPTWSCEKTFFFNSPGNLTNSTYTYNK